MRIQPNITQGEALVSLRALTDERLVIECNSEIVTHSQFSETLLTDGDQLEIVGAVGGG